MDASIDPCEAANGHVPPDSEIVYREGHNGPVLVKKKPLLESTDIVEVAVALAPPADEPTVVVRLTASAGQRLAKATQAHVGGSFAVVLDQRPIAIVRIAQPLGCWLQMSGGLGLNDAEELSVLLRAGFLPARLTVIEERVVAPPSK